ncbi:MULTISPECIES: MarC family protein [Prosthecochloris]|uniref:MarC family protein n=1 Tax=Prosthecochloris TaxID=1101 RepID=UPI001EFC4ED6|nr:MULTISPECIES: MarC family protein [Prosthecochloris]
MSHTLVMIGGYFAIMNPFANTAIFTAVTAGMDDRSVKKTAFSAVVTALGIVLSFILLGRIIFDFFGITLPALRVAGGIMVFFIGFDMMHGRTSAAHAPASDNSPAEQGQNIGISPLGIPILAGPGTIAVSMSYSATGNVQEIAINALVFSIMCMVTYVFFLLGEKVEQKLGQEGLKVITQLMGLILSVIGIQIGLEGIFGAISLFEQHHAS